MGDAKEGEDTWVPVWVFRWLVELEEEEQIGGEMMSCTLNMLNVRG